MKHAIENMLQPILGQRIWGIGRAASLLWLQIGDHQILISLKGASRELGTYALHIDCPWSWMEGGTIVADQDSDLAELTALVPVVCRSVIARENGSFELIFNGDSKLVVSVEADPDAQAEEYWRFFQPAEDEHHFVVGSKGIVQ
jgi:hypothetical protein